MDGERAKKRLRKRVEKWRKTCERSGKRTKNAMQGANRARKKSSVPRSVELALVREAFGSLERIKVSFSPTDGLPCVWYVPSQHAGVAEFTSAISRTSRNDTKNSSTYCYLFYPEIRVVAGDKIFTLMLDRNFAHIQGLVTKLFNKYEIRYKRFKFILATIFHAVENVTTI